MTRRSIKVRSHSIIKQLLSFSTGFAAFTWWPYKTRIHSYELTFLQKASTLWIYSTTYALSWFRLFEVVGQFSKNVSSGLGTWWLCWVCLLFTLDFNAIGKITKTQNKQNTLTIKYNSATLFSFQLFCWKSCKFVYKLLWNMSGWDSVGAFRAINLSSTM